MEGSFGRQPGNDFNVSPLSVVEPVALQGLHVPDREWLWRDWLPMHATTAFYGDGGTGKSLLAMQFMASVATGLPFLGCEVRQCRVLGVFCEDDPQELHRRQARINEQMGIDFSDLLNLGWVSRVGEENLLMTFASDGRGEPTPFFHQIVAEAKRMGAQLIMIDTAADTFGGNENIRAQVRQFISMLNRMALQIDGAVLLLAHPSQTGRAAGTGDGGSTAWSNSVRSRWYLRRDDDEKSSGANPNLRILSRMKANYASTGEKLTLEWENGAFKGDASVNAFDEAGAPIDRLDQADRAFLAGLEELIAKGTDCNIHKGQANFAPKAIRELTFAGQGFDVDELEAALKRLMRRDIIKSVKEGPPSRQRSRLVIEEPSLPTL
jgi:RecA-family ATPase